MTESKIKIIEKQYARRDILGYRSPYKDPFEYRPITSVEMDEVYSLIAKAPFFDVIPGTDPLSQTQIEFDILVEFAGSAYAPEHWLIAFKDGNPVGYVLPQRYWDVPEEGSIFALGVIPELQGRGYGKIIHSKGLEVLAQLGMASYVGSTETKNPAMIAIFLANDCKLSKIHRIEVDERGLQRII
ncbi:MAG TPA: GNAT family N-acetyltransferase [Candidatus Kapabacteria bacterium]|nr:GNAT family N-acetyltransferase [Candidatus Kapabacteria bacterium]